MQRREFLANSATVSAAAAVWALLSTSDANAASAAPDPLLDCVCDLVIPATETPGARASGVARFLKLAMTHGIAGSSPADRLQLEILLRTAAGNTEFLSLHPTEQLAILTRVDQMAFAERASLWARIKSLLLLGYYTSEIGCTKELYYEPVPGRFDPDLPFKYGDRGSATDWTGQRFG